MLIPPPAFFVTVRSFDVLDAKLMLDGTCCQFEDELLNKSILCRKASAFPDSGIGMWGT